MKLTAVCFAALVAMGCSRTSSTTQASPSSDAGAAAVVSSALDASTTTATPDAGATLDTYCDDIMGFGESPEGIMCRGEKIRPACDVQEKKKLPTLGKIVLVHEKAFEGTHAMFALVDASGHFAIVDRVLTEECDLGEPADVSLALVSATESAEGGSPLATIIYDSIRDDPPLQSGPRIHSSERRSVRCRAGAGAPVCDKPVTVGK